jgi:hypothetical protein
MKVTYAELRSKPRTFCSLTGLRVSEFEALLPSFGDAWTAFVRETFERASRKRAIGAGRKAHLKTLEDKLLFILMLRSHKFALCCEDSKLKALGVERLWANN